jgi:transcriptional regulator with XRE-family HTH domain
MSSDAPFAVLARNWRGRTDLKQAEAARVLGIDQSTLNKIEAGTRRASMTILDRMKEIYTLSDREVVEGVGAMAAGPDDAAVA